MVFHNLPIDYFSR